GSELTIAESQKSEGRSQKSHAGLPASDFRLRTSGFLLPVLCESAEGYRNLCRLITRMKMRAHAPGSPPRTPARWGGTPGSPPRTPARWGGKGEGALGVDELEGFTTGLVALVGRAALDQRQYGVGGLLDRIVGVFGRDRVYVELQRHLRRDEERDNDAL